MQKIAIESKPKVTSVLHFTLNISHGFTLIEMLVVLSIVIVLTGSIIVYSRRNESQLVFFREQSLLTTSLLRAKAFAVETFLPGQTLTGAGIPTPTEQVCAWGVHFEEANASSNGSYTIFRDLPSGGDCASGLQYEAGKSEGFESFSLPAAVVLKCLNLGAVGNDPCSGAYASIDTVFVPPDPTVYFHPQQSASEATIRIELKDDPTRFSILRITKAGQVNVE